MDQAFVGRYGELHRSLTLVKQCLEAAASPIFIEGEPGVGKTRLAEEICQQASVLGFRIMRGRALEFERTLPYACVADPLSALLDELGTDGVEARLGRSIRTLAPLVPGLPRRARPDDPDARGRAYAALARLLHRASDEEPTILFLDDIHWAD